MTPVASAQDSAIPTVSSHQDASASVSSSASATGRYSSPSKSPASASSSSKSSPLLSNGSLLSGGKQQSRLKDAPPPRRLLLRRASSLDAGLSFFKLNGKQNSIFDGSERTTPSFRLTVTSPGASSYDLRHDSASSSEVYHRTWINRLSFATPWTPIGGSGHHHSFVKPHAPSKAMLRAASLLAFSLLVLTLVGILNIDAPEARRIKQKLGKSLESYGVRLIPLSCSNPYAEQGILKVDVTMPEANQWRPYDPTCTAPDLMAQIRMRMSDEARSIPSEEAPMSLKLPLPLDRPRPGTGLSLPWLVGKTVVLVGDHAERLHSKDFCRFSGGRFASIGAGHRLSPRPFHNGIDEKLGSRNFSTSSYDSSRPTVCYLEEYDFMIVSVFHFGLLNRVEAERETLLFDKHFYPPVAVRERFSHIAQVLLKNLKRRPDFIEFSSSTWDLRHFSQLDQKAQKDGNEPLSEARIKWYTHRLKMALAYFVDEFPGVPIIWRTLHQTPLYESTPFERTAELDRVSRNVVDALNRKWSGTWISSPSARGGGYDFYDLPKGSPSAGVSSERQTKGKAFPSTVGREDSFLARVNNRINGEGPSMEDYYPSNFQDFSAIAAQPPKNGPRIRINEWGKLMLGQPTAENHLYSPPLPGGYLWGDILLYMLQQEFGS